MARGHRDPLHYRCRPAERIVWRATGGPAAGLAGIRQACVSNSSRRIVDANLATLTWLPYLQFSISLDDVVNGKPHREPYATAARRLGVEPQHLLAVEDNDSGLASASAAGLRTAVIGGDHSARAHWLIDLPIEVVDIVLPHLRGRPDLAHR
ncbi:HAD family hydrolase [Bradyrhizobium sp. USDA 3458]|uniref:HAD family hydrolase n=1 Tax=Bradyrhizobium sp. USDA 3458 TaxID=2591461 RepID=UPI001143C7C7|nr:HAD family hydrolase [Bradyrhizobium sp. USDA 3458]